MIDQVTLRAVEAYIHAGLPAGRRRRAAGRGGRPARRAATSRPRRCWRAAAPPARATCGWPATTPSALKLWKGRKQAFGALGRLAPNYYTHDGVIPRTRLPEVLEEIGRIAERHQVTHRQRLSRRRRQPAPGGAVRRARARGASSGCKAAGDGILRLVLSVGGALSGEHGIGLEKIGYMDAALRRGRPGRDAPAARRVQPARAVQPGQGDPRARPLRRAGRGQRPQAAAGALMRRTPHRRACLPAGAAVAPASEDELCALRARVRRARGSRCSCEGSGTKRHHGPAARRARAPAVAAPADRGSPPTTRRHGGQRAGRARAWSICSARWPSTASGCPSIRPTPTPPSAASWPPPAPGPRRLGYGTIKDCLLGLRVVGAERGDHQVGRPGGQERQRLRPAPAAGGRLRLAGRDRSRRTSR